MGRPPVHADGTQVEDGGRAQQNVHGHERVTEARAQQPDAPLDLGREQKQQQMQDSSGSTRHPALALLSVLTALQCSDLTPALYSVPTPGSALSVFRGHVGY